MREIIEKFRESQYNKLSLILYIIVGVIVLVPGLIIMFIKPEFLKTYQTFSLYLIIPMLLTAFFIDSWLFLKKIWNTIFGKILYIFIVYFSYSLAVIYAEKSIYFYTTYNPDVFQSSINLLAGIYMLPAVLSVISFLLIVFVGLFSLFVIIAFVITFLVHIPCMIYNIFSFSNKKLNGQDLILNLVNKIFKIKLGQIIFRIFMFCFVFSFFGIVLFYVEQFMENKIHEFITKPTIAYASYYENRTICKNKSIDDNTLIKFLDTDNISTVKVTLSKSFSKDMFIIKFGDIEKCIRSDK